MGATRYSKQILAPNCFSLKSEIRCSVPFIKADSVAAEGMQAGKRKAQDYSKLTAGVACGSYQFLTTESIFAVEVIIRKMLQVGLTPVAADSHSYLLLCFS